MRRMTKGYWVLAGLLVGVAVALTITGIALIATQETTRGATRAANAGARTQPILPTPLQEGHENLSAVAAVLVWAGAAWLMVRIKQDFSEWLAAAMGLTIVVAVTGMFLQFTAVSIDGVFLDELQTWEFVLDGGLDEVTFGNRTLGALTYRIFFAIHVFGAVALGVATFLGFRDVRRGRR